VFYVLLNEDEDRTLLHLTLDTWH